MSIVFQKTDDLLSIIHNKVPVVDIEKDDDGLYYWEPEKKHESCTQEIFELDSNKIPINLYVTDYYKCNNYPSLNMLTLEFENNNLFVTSYISFRLFEWSQPFTIEEFLNEFQTELKHLKYDTNIYIDEISGIETKHFINNNTNIKDYIESFGIKAKSIAHKLIRKNTNKIITKVFNFPNNYEYIYSQYLMSFGEFLSNIGIDANIATSINNDNSTIVTILNNDKNHSIVDIENIFYTYLSIPYTDKLLTTSINDNSSNNIFNSLLVQIEFLKAQIQNKNLMLTSNSITISEIEKDNSKLSSKILFLESLEDENIDEIKIFNGSITIGEFKYGAIKINPKKMLEGLKTITNK